MPLNSVSFDHMNKILSVGCDDGTVKFYDVKALKSSLA